ncbi:adhesion G-protein coupled receptor G6-like [Octopus vulgaris]|uniref:Adhesion G-protein coupled receptor G6-like n=1 Tax=Octopus vulgaris TaxID=6645 RepID=A0AA36C0B1_OCTVU|nr:adhesion G-protein coupled receptor G6-like [Octopus vulgaris]
MEHELSNLTGTFEVAYCGVYLTACTLQRVPYSVYLTACTLQRVPYSVYLTACTLQCVPYNVYLTVCTLQRLPYSVYLTTFTLQCVPYNVYLTVCTLQRVPYSVYLTACTLQRVPYSVYLTACTLQRVPYSVYLTVCTLQRVPYSVYLTTCTLQCVPYNVYLTVCTLQRVPYNVYLTACTLQRVPYNVYLTVCTLQRVPYSVYLTTFTLQCVPYNVYLTVCTLQRLPYSVYLTTCTLQCVPYNVYLTACTLQRVPYNVYLTGVPYNVYLTGVPYNVPYRCTLQRVPYRCTLQRLPYRCTLQRVPYRCTLQRVPYSVYLTACTLQRVPYSVSENNSGVFTINCTVSLIFTKDQIFKQVSETFKTSQTLRDLGLQQRNTELFDEMVCNENTTPTSNDTFYWPVTKVGTNVTIPCHANVATRRCSSRQAAHSEKATIQHMTSPKCSPFTGVWQEPDMSHCYNTERITQQLKNITNEDIDKENVEEVSKALRIISEKSVYFKAEDIDLAVDIQEKMVPLISNVSANITVNNILLSINDMIDTPEEILMEAEQSKRTGQRMLDIIEAIPEEIPLEEQQLTIAYSNIGIGITKVEENSFNGLFYGVLYGNNETEIHNYSNPDPQVEDTGNFISLQKSLFKQLKEEERSTISRIAFFSLKDDKLYRVIQHSRTKANTKINSHIIAADVPNIQITSLDEPVNISFGPIDQDVYQKSGETSHLLSMTSYIGCGISFVCLILTIIIHICCKNLRKLMASKILINLCVSLAITNLIFLVGMQPYASKITDACKAVAVLLHYFLMTSLMWMAVEALHVFLAAVVVFKTFQSHFLLTSSIVAWAVG